MFDSTNLVLMMCTGTLTQQYDPVGRLMYLLEPFLLLVALQSVLASFIPLKSCTVSYQTPQYTCDQARDLVTNQKTNGWHWSNTAPSWVEFVLEWPSTLSTVIIHSGFNKDFTIRTFRIELHSNGEWMNIEDVTVKNAPAAEVAEDGTVGLVSDKPVAEVKFKQVQDVSILRLSISKTSQPNGGNNAVVNEVLVPCK